jgi:23S rRNA pseudouridine1911/1915/1917 synthase
VQGKQRLDRALAEAFPDFSRSRLQKLIEQGNVQVNGAVCTNKKQSIPEGATLLLSVPPLAPLSLQPESIPLDVLYEDEHLIIVNKPAGLVVHPAPGHESGTLVNALLAHCDHLAGIGGVERPGIVHRLDKDTSGALVVAKNDFAHQHLQGQIQAKTAKREYLGIIHGVPKGEQGTMDQPIGRHRVDRKKMAVVPVEKGGRPAITHWQLQERLGNYSLLTFELETGRTHQIRVHCAAMGHPLVGDPVYSSAHRFPVNLSGQVLHARKLTLTHPVTGETICAIAPLPSDFTKLLAELHGNSKNR